ncbi:unnamed protein product, partial [Symbiodinium sp. CCMP2456]
MTTQALQPLDRDDSSTESAGMIEVLARHFFGLETDDSVGVDAAQEVEMSKLIQWAGQVLGTSLEHGVVHLTGAVAAAVAAGVPGNPYECEAVLRDVVPAVNEAMAQLREFKVAQAKTQEVRNSVCKQGETMILKLKQKLEEGEISEDDLHQRCKSVTVWQSKKDSDLDVSMGDLEAKDSTQTTKTDGSMLAASNQTTQTHGSMLAGSNQTTQTHDSMQLEMHAAAVAEAESLQGGAQTAEVAEAPKRQGAIYRAIEEGLIDEILRRPESFQIQEATLKRKENETYEEHILRIAHNVYMKFNRSTKSKACPPEVIDAAKKARSAGGKIENLFLDYLRCSGNWLSSTLVMQTKRVKDKELKMEEAYIMFKDLKQKHGSLMAKSIRDEKRAMQEALDKDPKADPDTLPWVLAHPDLPGSEAEEYKKLRKAGKGGFANQVKNKTKLVNDKIEDLDAVQDVLQAKPPHMSEPLRKGYMEELQLHREAMLTSLQNLKADELEDSPEKQQACLEALAEVLKAYQDAASMIKKKDLSFCGAAAMLRHGHKDMGPGLQWVEAAGGNLGLVGNKLRRAGCDGKHPSNIERDMLRAATKSMGSDTWLEISSFCSFAFDSGAIFINRDLIRGSYVLCSGPDADLDVGCCWFRAYLKLGRTMPVILPHDLLAFMHSNGMQEIDEGACRKHWEHLTKFTSWAAGHPCNTEPTSSSQLPVATFLYGDDIKHSQNEKLTVMYLGYSLADKKMDSMKSHFPLFVIREVIQSLNAAMRGFWPSTPLLTSDGSVDSAVPLSQQPLVVHNGNVCRFPVTEIR